MNRMNRWISICLICFFASCQITPPEPELELVLSSPISVSPIRAIVLSRLENVGEREITDRGYIISETDGTTIQEVKVSDLRRVGTIKHRLFGLKPNTNYTVAAYATAPNKEIRSNEITFVTTSLPSQDFQIGDKGPGGGLVFFDWGDYSRGYRYMEARLLEAPFYDYFVWSPLEFTLIGTKRDFGSGEFNTDLYLQKILNTNPLNAFYSVSIFEKNGFGDWFIPSVEELAAIYENLPQEILQNEFIQSDSNRFLSSTEVDFERVLAFHANSQTESITYKGIGHNVLAVRVF